MVVNAGITLQSSEARASPARPHASGNLFSSQPDGQKKEMSARRYAEPFRLANKQRAPGAQVDMVDRVIYQLHELYPTDLALNPVAFHLRFRQQTRQSDL